VENLTGDGLAAPPPKPQGSRLAAARMRACLVNKLSPKMMAD
jgi:hypothetical protein